jgi:hypothetical protein
LWHIWSNKTLKLQELDYELNGLIKSSKSIQ